MHVHVAEIAAGLDGLVTWSALREAGLSRSATRRATDGLRRMHDGVFLTGHGRVTDHQRRLAATLTAPGTVLSHSSTAAARGFRPHLAGFEVVTRAGTGGPRRIDRLLICRSALRPDEIVVHDGIPMTTPARTIVDLCAHLTERQRAKAVREALRLRVMTALELRLAAARHRGRRGTRGLDELAARLERLPLGRARSDAEGRALEVLDVAGVPAPLLNVRHAGEEADLSWPAAGLIIEIDGPQFHRDPDEDARKDAVWRGAGWVVVRISSDAVFRHPELLPQITTVHGVSPAGTP
jgi:Protein of unknown function (DUF559)